MNTPFRQTDIILDADHWAEVEPTFRLCKFASKMFADSPKDSKLVMYKNGLIVRPYNMEQGILVEQTVGQGLALALFTSAEYTEEYHWAKPISSEMPGATLGTGVTTQGNKLWTKKINASNSWGDGVLTADAAAYPSPTYTDDGDLWQGYNYDRVAYTTSNIECGDDLWFEIKIEQAEEDHPAAVAIIQFTGPPSNGDADGYQYALIYNSYGRITLLCKINGVWKRVAKANGTKPLYNHSVIVITKSEWGTEENAGLGGYINILQMGVGEQGWLSKGIIEKAYNLRAYAKSKTDAPEFGALDGAIHYKVPASSMRTKTLTEIEGKVHIDIRRDIMAHFALRKSGFPTDEIVVNDDPFHVNTYYRDATGANDLYLVYWFRRPAGTAVDVTLRNHVDDVELTETFSEEILVRDDLYVGHKVYTLVRDKNVLHVKISLLATSEKTPKLYYYNVEKNGIIIKNVGQEKTLHTGTYSRAYGTKVGIIGPIRAIDNGKATITIADLNDSLSVLATRASIPIRIETSYNPNNPTAKCVLFRGYVQKAIRNIHSAPLKRGQVHRAFSTYELLCNGTWQLLKENFHENQAEILFEDTVTEDNKEHFQQGCKVTELVSRFLSRVGFLPESSTITADEATQDIPDKDIRVFPWGTNDNLVVNPLDDLQKVIESLVRDYLGGYLIWDDNLGVNGKWIYKDPPDPFNDVPKAVFYTDPPSHVSGKKIDYLPSYDNSPVTVNAVEYLVPGSYIVKGTYNSWVKPPEANDIIVTGIGAITEKGGNRVDTARLFNKDSFNVDPNNPTADPTNPDYLGRRVPLWVYDSSVALDQSATKVALICRRIYDMVAHGIKCASFKAPLVFVSNLPDDANKVRPLRYYDLIYINDSPWLVRSVNPQYTKDGQQWAMYEVEAPRIGVLMADRRGAFFKAIDNVFNSNIGLPKNGLRVFGQQVMAGNNTAEVMSLPASDYIAMQNTDSTDPNFGEFIYMAEIDGLESAPIA